MAAARVMRRARLGGMHLDLSPNSAELGRRAGAAAAAHLRIVLSTQRRGLMVLAAAPSQYATLDVLVAEPGIAWDRVEVFHLDEYVGLASTHGASFRRFLAERFLARVPTVAAFHAIAGDAADPQAECHRLASVLAGRTIDLGLIGIGENGHLAFNDPPADFATTAIYHVVPLDEACRRQQVGEGWYPSLAAVPATAISMSVPAIMACRALICSVPDARKAAAVRAAVEGPLSVDCPASILRTHADCTLYLDHAAAGQLSTGEKSCAG